MNSPTDAASDIRRPALYVVATPIGNLGDVTRRAVHVLQGVDLIAAEDTRHSARLLQHLGVSTALTSYHDHSSEQERARLLQRLQSGLAVALITDAGTPLISDPGYGLVTECHRLGVPVIAVPGACALIAALSIAGLPSDRFAFEGFLPARRGARQTFLRALTDEARTLVFYESPHRIVESLQDMAEVFGGERLAVIARELTKTWEQVHGAPLHELLEWIQQDPNRQRGEFVVLLQGAAVREREIDAEVERVLKVLMAELPLKQAAALAAEITGQKKNALYKHALTLESKGA